MDDESNRLALSMASKLSVLELAFATLIERLALQTANPSEEVHAFVQAVKAKADQVATMPAQQNAEWLKAMSASVQNFEEMLRFSFPGQKRDEPMN